MVEDGIFIGIDTSNYTTSVAVCTRDGKIVLNLKNLLDVGDGERGLRQSDALFLHNRNLPILMSELSDFLEREYPNAEILGVGYSAYPRDCEGSYMPCFLAGKVAAYSFCASRRTPIYKFSHQAGHIAAALYSSGAESEILRLSKEFGGKFASFHVSGGTTEVLLTDAESIGNIELIGGTKDINAGQAIDRTGVMMGMKFPCGRQMESLCGREVGNLKRTRVCVDGLHCNLSGLENQARKLYADTSDKGQVCEFVFDFIGKTLYEITCNLRKIYGQIPVLYAGGVMSNGRIKNILSSNDGVYFAMPEFSSDNASGVALLCRRSYLGENGLT